jgi:hypothetical protein
MDVAKTFRQAVEDDDRFAHLEPYCDDDRPFATIASERYWSCLMKTLLALLFSLLIAPIVAAVDPVSELAGFSVFGTVDLEQLAKSDAKTAHGPPMKTARFISVQSCYVAPGSPSRQLEALRQFNPTQHRELKVFLHVDLPGSPSAGNFSKLSSAPDNGPVRTLVVATQKQSADLQLSRDEAKKNSTASAKGSGAMPASVAAFWGDVSSARAKSFASGGVSTQPPYDRGGNAIRAGDEFIGLLREQEKIRKQFGGLIDNTGIGHSSGSLKPELYWELLEAEDQGVLTLGAFYNQSGNAGVRAADALYYASGGYYVSLTLYQMWPVNVGGKESTLVWRGDMTSAASLADLHGVEKLASESAMMKEISKSISLFRRDSSGAH